MERCGRLDGRCGKAEHRKHNWPYEIQLVEHPDCSIAFFVAEKHRYPNADATISFVYLERNTPNANP
jgi:hypothetical protein